ncbi:SdpI family protein [Spirochaeta isovalerica]|uniref:Putative membrane protein n=1 Tax=Spirochaeta isovalerica TaxID=150 RepID=A0A841RDD1_9SPIO|nr:SdpI family protein [Spirochaeta isovalerica]MBB6480859.1 putative membrane protein [Spirochaeta isovalerica]
MKINKFILALIVLSMAGTAVIYGSLPERIALHFNINGEVDRWGGRASIWITASIPLAVYLLLLFVPRIDPRRDSYSKHTRGYAILANTITLFLIGLNWFTILYSLGYDLSVQMYVLSGIGILFMIIGNHLPNARQNYTFGIRTPWTLADETSWVKTHRLGGIGFVATGVIAIVAAWLPGLFAFIIFLTALVILLALIFIYSYLVFKRQRAGR